MFHLLPAVALGEDPVLAGVLTLPEGAAGAPLDGVAVVSGPGAGP